MEAIRHNDSNWNSLGTCTIGFWVDQKRVQSNPIQALTYFGARATSARQRIDPLHSADVVHRVSGTAVAGPGLR